MDIPFTARLTVPDTVLLRTFEDGESVILNLETEHYYGLNEVGTRMWTALTTAESIEAAYELLLEEYDVEPEELREDLEELIGELTTHHLLITG